jgi:hypothetical protein
MLDPFDLGSGKGQPGRQLMRVEVGAAVLVKPLE